MIFASTEGSSFDQTHSWLQSEGLSEADGEFFSTSLVNPSGLFAQPVNGKAARLTQKDLRALRKSRMGQLIISPEEVWREAQLLKMSLINIDMTRYPADAIAFYRPFHFASQEEWGIYFDIEALLRYTHRIFAEMRGKIASFDYESLLTACLCEIFHHEYFHHISECAATTIEILYSQAGARRPIYMDYSRRRFYSEHAHSPLEEALANAYAYNSLSFLSRVKAGLRTTRIRVLQNAIRKYWPTEPPGYREAEHYIDEKYVLGAGQLVKLMLPRSECPSFVLELIAKEVLLNGNATYFAKPDIPVYFCGSVESVAHFNELVPAPVEAYSSLAWLDDSSAVDSFFDAKRKEDQARRRIG